MFGKLFISKRKERVILSLMLMSGFAVLLFATRAVLYFDLYMLGINWNLFLAWIPLLCVTWLQRQSDEGKVTMTKLVISSLVWLAFFPNSPYIITDFVHLFPKYDSGLYWHEQLTFFGYAISALLAGMVSMYWIKQLWVKYTSVKTSWIALIISIALSGYGIYLGRIERWNSWDIIAQPFSLVEYILRSMTYRITWMFVVEYGLFVAFCYAMVWSLAGEEEEL